MEFRTLGPLEVLQDGRPLALGGRKQRSVLALLLLRAGEVVSRDTLIDELWQGRPPPGAETTLSSYLSRLRKAFGAEAARFLARAPGYLLRLEPGELDAERFERALAEGRQALAEGDPARAAEKLRAGLALWRGRPLADLAYEGFARTEIDRLEELRLAGIELRLEADLALGRHAELVAELESLVAANPLRERLRAQLMLALYGAGRQAEALESYRTARRALVDGLGIDPGQELQALEKAILNQDPALRWEPRDTKASRPARRLAFVGRERELAELRAGLDDALAGRGRLFLVSGEPGVGKSRLVEELTLEARSRGGRILVGRCWEAGGAPAYWPWVQALRSYVRATSPDDLRAQLGSGGANLATILPELHEVLPGLPPPDESEGARFRLFDSTVSFLREASRVQPLVLVLDDLHEGDVPSLLLLQFLARELAESRILVVGAYRDVDPVPADPLAVALAELVREPVTQPLPLGGLNESEAAAFIELVTAHTPSASLAAAVHAETEGNPLFLGETVRLMAAEGLLEGTAEPRRIPVPQSVKDVIGRRLRRLSPECNRVLTLAAVLGREFDLDVLGNVSGAGHDALLDALDEAIAARVVADVPGATGRLRFAHALIRDTVYEALTGARRARLHGQVAAALETLYSGNLEPRLAELAYHYFEAVPAGFPGQAATYAQRAGERAASLLAYEEAVRLYELALELTRDGTPRCELLLAVGDAQARAGDTSSAKETFREAADLARSLELAELLGRAALGYGGRIIWDTSRNDDALVPLLEGALAAVGRGDSAIRVRLTARLAGGPLRDARFPPERRVALSEEALSMARRLGDRATLAYALDGYISSRHSPEFTPEQVARATELVETAAEAGDLERQVEGHEHRLSALLELGEMKRAKDDLDAIVDLARKLRQPSQIWYAAENRAMLALLEGRFEEAEELIGEALSLGQDPQPWNATFSYRLQLYVLRWEQERLNEISPLVQGWVGEYPTYPLWRCILAHMLNRVGRETEARSIFEPLAADGFAAIPFDESWLVAMAVLTENAAAFGDSAAAATLYERLLPYADRVAVSYSEISTGAVARSLGILASTTLHWSDSERFFEKALDLNAKIGARPWVVRTMREYACMLRSRHHQGDAGRAEALLEQAEALRRTIDTSIPA